MEFLATTGQTHVPAGRELLEAEDAPLIGDAWMRIDEGPDNLMGGPSRSAGLVQLAGVPVPMT